MEEINKLQSDIKNNIKNQGYSLQSAFDKYFDEIKRLKNKGVKYQFIYEQLDLGISLPHFHNLLYRANKKQLILSEAEQTTSNKTPSDVKTEPIQQKQNNYSETDWKPICFFNDHLIQKAIATNLSPDQIKEWQCANEIQLSNRLSEYRQRKMKQKRK